MKLNPNCSEWTSRIEFDIGYLTDEERKSFTKFIGDKYGSMSKSKFDAMYEELTKLPYWSKLDGNYMEESES
jgi:hypothetical protein